MAKELDSGTPLDTELGLGSGMGGGLINSLDQPLSAEGTPKEQTREQAQAEIAKVQEAQQAQETQRAQAALQQRVAQLRAQELQFRNAVHAERAYIQSQRKQLAEFLEGIIPEEPDASLAQTNPTKYMEEKSIRDQAIAELNGLAQQHKAMDARTRQEAAQQHRQRAEREFQALRAAMPALNDKAFAEQFKKAVDAGAAEFGFSQQELQSVADHRVIRMIYYAQKGLEAERGGAKAQS